jgi:hypothetical protein
MFYDGYPQKGVCPGGAGGHAAAGFLFVLARRRDPKDPILIDEG